MYGETFYGRHTAQHQLQWSLGEKKKRLFNSKLSLQPSSCFPISMHFCNFKITPPILQRRLKRNQEAKKHFICGSNFWNNTLTWHKKKIVNK